MGLRTWEEKGSGFIRQEVMLVDEVISDRAVDTGNSGKTHELRPGLAMGRLTTGGKLVQYDNLASDGSQTCVGYLKAGVDLKMGDASAASTDQPGVVLWIGEVRTDQLIGSDAAAEADLAQRIVHK